MRKKNVFLAALLLSGALLLPTLHAQDIRTRMKQRIPQIIQLKKAGTVGENEKGYLDFYHSIRFQFPKN